MRCDGWITCSWKEFYCPERYVVLQCRPPALFATVGLVEGGKEKECMANSPTTCSAALLDLAVDTE